MPTEVSGSQRASSTHIPTGRSGGLKRLDLVAHGE
jgi:hypothetical protein